MFMSTFWCPEKTLYIKDLPSRLFPLLPATHYGSNRNVASVRVRIPASVSLHPFFSVVCTPTRYPSPEQEAGASRTRSLFSEALENLVRAQCAAVPQLNPCRDRKRLLGAGLTDYPTAEWLTQNKALNTDNDRKLTGSKSKALPLTQGLH